MRSAEFFFDLSSPYSYLASTQLPGIAARTGASFVWRPMVLGAVFKATGNATPASVMAKAAYMGMDLDRWARHYGVGFRFSSHFPVNALSAMRLIVVAKRHDKVIETASAAFRAVWVENRDVTKPEELAAIATSVGLPADSAAAISEQAIKDELRANTDDAVTKGVFGAPAIVIGNDLYWGNDRLHFVEAALSAASGPGT